MSCYQHPQTGERLYAPYGELVRGPAFVTCHICGLDFRGLASHTWQVHGCTADDYRREFGLRGYQGLICIDLENRKRSEGKRRMRSRPELFRRFKENGQTPEVRKRQGETFSQRVKEGRVTLLGAPPEFFDGSGHERLRELWAEDGEWAQETRTKLAQPRGGQKFFSCQRCRCVFEDYQSTDAKYCKDCAPYYAKEVAGPRLHRQYMDKLATDPAFHERVAERARALNREVSVRRRKPHPCTVCGKMIPRSHPLTCGPECRSEAHRRNALAVADARFGADRPRTCTVLACESRVLAWGLCNRHYQQQRSQEHRRNGSKRTP